MASESCRFLMLLFVFKKKNETFPSMLEECASLPAPHPPFPSSGSSLSKVTVQCFSTQKIPWCFRRGCMKLGETSFCLSSQSHAICITLFTRLLLCTCRISINCSPSNPVWILWCLPHSVARNNLRKSRVTWQPPETFTYLWSCLCKEHWARVPLQQGNHEGQMHHNKLELQHLQRRTIC